MKTSDIDIFYTCLLQIVFGSEIVLIKFELVDVAPVVGDVAQPIKEVQLDAATKLLTEKLKSNTFEIQVFNGEAVKKIFIILFLSGQANKYQICPLSWPLNICCKMFFINEVPNSQYFLNVKKNEIWNLELYTG